ncbi:hypothetical protein [Parabacteroides sp. PF5-9]|uniref:hypothetical protein n=1 Tax=Parabacteroides sp. PF5-9 TaxID=1742404 RepID=UPI0024752AAC|nr:hypothetical protein [Parabacteroides sp. PF5-9]MDH6357291.1 hypothetical protein [Parabacteroides sp. PF5-9]
MKKIVFIFCLILGGLQTINGQRPINWEALANVQWKNAYVKVLDGYYAVPSFSSGIESINDHEISIRGYYVPINMETNMFALSKTPSNMCFFCGTGGMETVMEIVVKAGHNDLKRMQTDKFLELKGTFVINRDDPYHLMYQLVDAELVKVVR